MADSAITAVLAQARRVGRQVLIEPEGLALLHALGVQTPAWFFVERGARCPVADLSGLPGPKVVVKIVSPDILHKTEMGGVAIVPKRREDVDAAMAAMATRASGAVITGFTVSEFVSYRPELGHELLVGLRWTADAGPVVTVGAGGIYTEFLAEHFRTGRSVAIVSPAFAQETVVRAALDGVAAVRLVTRSQRGQPPRIDLTTLEAAVAAFVTLARDHSDEIGECEVNPFVVTGDGRLVALDVLVKLRAGPGADPAPPRPLHKLRHLLEPSTAAIMGVSARLNPGHLILNNLLREGFDRSRIVVVKPGTDEIEGCRCVPDIASLGGRVDLFVLAVDAAQAASAVDDIIERQAAESIVLIPGGLEETSGGGTLAAGMRTALDRARRSDWGGPLINGGNCLGIRSLPGRYDTTFIPEHKLPMPSGPAAGLAVISQSGAFAITRTSKLGVLNPKYMVTLGNQMDLTVGDYLTYLKDDKTLEVFAVYVEGFRPLDLLRTLTAAREIVDSGRTVLLYRAGRTAAGARASASHTASIAGDYSVTCGLARSVGIVVADSLDEFTDLTMLFSLLRDARVSGWRLGAVSNAGYECVALADNLGSFTLARFSAATERRVRDTLVAHRLDRVVDAHNPIDLTPMAGDAAFGDVIDALVEDEASDAVVVGNVPFTAAMSTLPPGPTHGEDLARAGAFLSRVVAARRASAKPLVAVVDAGPLYDPLVQALLEQGIPAFRSADRAMRLLNIFCAARLEAPQEPGSCGA